MEDKNFAENNVFTAAEARELSSQTTKSLKRIYKLIKEQAVENCSMLRYEFIDVKSDPVFEIMGALRKAGYDVDVSFEDYEKEETYTDKNVCLVAKDYIFDRADLKISW